MTEYLPLEEPDRIVFLNILLGDLPKDIASDHSEISLFSYIVAVLYALLGDLTIWVRLFNILLSMGSALMLYVIMKRLFDDLAANLFLLIALFLPTQVGYSITLSRDFIRVFFISLMLWSLYMGVHVAWRRR